MSRRGGKAVNGAKPALTEFHVGFGIAMPDERNGLRSCAEGPFARLRGFGARDGMRVRRRRLRRILRWMTRLAGFGSGVVRRGAGRRRKKENGER
jgi:hypothetical protein